MTTLVLEFKKVERANDKKHSAHYSSLKAETNIYVADIGDAFQWVYNTIISNMQKSLGKSFG